MDHRRHILPSSYPPQQLALDDHSGLSQVKQSLSDSAGNAQLHALASVRVYHDNKTLQPRMDKPLYSIPTLPSNPPRQPLANTLELRRQSTRRRRHQRYSRNPIVDSPQYQAYRARQNREGNPEDAKWPEVLEIAFLDGTHYCFLSYTLY
jgi:transcriptional enhancer factor